MRHTHFSLSELTVFDQRFKLRFRRWCTGVPPPPPPGAEMVAFYTFDEGSGAVILGDVSGNGKEIDLTTELRWGDAGGVESCGAHHAHRPRRGVLRGP